MLIIRNKVKLRTALPEDAELLCKWYSDGRIMVHVGFENGLHEDVDKLRQKISTAITQDVLAKSNDGD